MQPLIETQKVMMQSSRNWFIQKLCLSDCSQHCFTRVEYWWNQLRLLLFVTLGSIASVSHSDDLPPEHVKYFEREVRPLLSEKCFGCHGEEDQGGDLRLDSYAHIMRGGESGDPALLPGKPDESLLIDAINYESYEMPPDKRLSDKQIETLTRWVAIGAPWPGADPNAPIRKREVFDEHDRSWWAIQRIEKPRVPPAEGEGWEVNPIDHFVLDRMLSEGLSPAPRAEKVRLVRRLYLDVTGLPPTPEQVTNFVESESPDAYEKLVDSLIASKGYGEHAARQWLDLVRYADSDGYRADGYRPHAWRYRDYVIKSFNDDKPYDRFVQEQVAGDEMFPDDLEAQIALGYLRQWVYEWNIRDAETQWNTIIEDLTDTTADVFVGLGLQCAKCHNHKFDPLLQKDYFRFRAFFDSILPDDAIVATGKEITEYQDRLDQWEKKTNSIREKIKRLEEPYRKKYRDIAINRFPEHIQAFARKSADQRTTYQEQIAYLVQRQVQSEYERLDNYIKGEDKEKLVALRRKLKAFEKAKPKALPTAMVISDVSQTPAPTRMPKRKDLNVEPGIPSILDENPLPISSPTSSSTGRRTALAKWITAADNPLTSRVIANRIWQRCFGQGLAANTSDFGVLGGPPSHPELLDWLAAQLIEDGWSLKSLHRKILLSATYRQSTDHPQFALYQTIDPSNDFYWRSNTSRLSAEQIRDSLLIVTGRLKNRNGGPSVHSDSPYRTIYTRVMRNSPDELLGSFDLPQFFSSNSSRNTTTTPIQSLLLFNSDRMLGHARRLAEKTSLQSNNQREQVCLAWRSVFSRKPTEEEIESSLNFLGRQAQQLASSHEKASGDTTRIETSKLPYRDGQALQFKIDEPMLKLSIPSSPDLQLDTFTIEAFFQLRSIASTGTVRSIVSKWNAQNNAQGWNFGVTGKGSRRKPQTLVMHMFGPRSDGHIGEVAVFSDQHIAFDTPYYSSASVKLAREGRPGTVTFYLKDLSNDDEPLQVATVEHNLSDGIRNDAAIAIGRRGGTNSSRFDGLIDDVRLVNRALSVEEILYTNESEVSGVVGFWQFEVDPGVRSNSVSAKHTLIAEGKALVDLTPSEKAMVDYCHTLLNANEFLYVD